MSTVAKLIEYLQTLPKDAEVSVMVKKEHSDYNRTEYTEFETLCLEPEFPAIPGCEGKSSKHIEVSDCTTNPHMKPENRKVYVNIGGEE